MSKTFGAILNEALSVEREYRALTSGRLSLRAYIGECLARAGSPYQAVEAVKERMVDPVWYANSGCRAYIREVLGLIKSGRLPVPPAKERIGGLYWAQRDEAIHELSGGAEQLFLLFVIAAEMGYQENPGVFGTVEDLEKHQARIAELETRRGELWPRIAVDWDNSDVHIGRITSDAAALITFARAPGEVPIHPRPSAGARLVDYLLRQEQAAAKSKAA